MYFEFFLVFIVTITIKSVQKEEKKFIKKRRNLIAYLKTEEFTEKRRNQITYLKTAEEFIKKRRNSTAYLKTEIKGWKG